MSITYMRDTDKVIYETSITIEYEGINRPLMLSIEGSELVVWPKDVSDSSAKRKVSLEELYKLIEFITKVSNVGEFRYVIKVS